MHLVRELVRHGYVVAAPTYPLTSRVAFTGVRGPDISDTANQVKDVAFVLDRLLADPFFGSAIDSGRIGIAGHSLGGVTSYFAVFGQGRRDPRVRAVAMIGAGDPVQTALAGDMGLWGTGHAAVSVPALFLSGEKDVFARTTGRPHAAFARIERPKYEVMIAGGVHVWFHDGDEAPPGNKNPDCLFFENWAPQMVVPGCEERVPLIGAEPQRAITRAAIRSFFDGHLKSDAAALARLRGLGSEFAGVRVLAEE
jgi:predicted dienelactone hydrolase